MAGCGSESLSGNGEDVAPEAPTGAGSARADADSLKESQFGASAGDAASAGVGGAPGEGGSLPLPQTVDRKIIRTATLELEVEDVGAAVGEVERVATTAGGFVSESNVFIDESSESEGEDDGAPRRTQTATVTIRVPAEVYGSVVSQLRSIAEEVRSERSEASEVTEEFTDLQSRLRNLEATEASYLELLTRAEDIPDILTVQDRLSSVRLEIEQVQGRINLLESLTDLATITVRLALPATPAGEPDGGRGWAAEAWDAAWDGSQDAMVVLGTVAIVGGVALVWLVIVGLAALIAWRLIGWRLWGPVRQAVEEVRRPRGGEAGGTGTGTGV
jgi:hypothetical protein